jgi:hypothetical protein
MPSTGSWSSSCCRGAIRIGPGRAGIPGGICLWWTWSRGPGPAGSPGELRTAGQQTIASRRGVWDRGASLSTGGRKYTLTSKLDRGLDTDPLITELIADGYRDWTGHFADTRTGYGAQTSIRTQQSLARLRALVDEAGMPVLFVTGQMHASQATARITFPDRQWLRFPLRGGQPDNAIMTAVDQAGSRVIRYRLRGRRDYGADIIVAPDRMLTGHLVAAIAVSASWLRDYFSTGALSRGGSNLVVSTSHGTSRSFSPPAICDAVNLTGSDAPRSLRPAAQRGGVKFRNALEATPARLAPCHDEPCVFSGLMS